MPFNWRKVFRWWLHVIIQCWVFKSARLLSYRRVEGGVIFVCWSIHGVIFYIGQGAVIFVIWLDGGGIGSVGCRDVIYCLLVVQHTIGKVIWGMSRASQGACSFVWLSIRCSWVVHYGAFALHPQKSHLHRHGLTRRARTWNNHVLFLSFFPCVLETEC